MSPATVHQLRPDSLTTDLDQLAELRALLKRATAEERDLTARVLAQLDQLGVTALRTADTVARVDTVTTLSIDPGLFVLACGDLDRAASALRVSVEKARECLDGATVTAIAQSTVSRRLVVQGR
jgi:hypothetical protein